MLDLEKINKAMVAPDDFVIRMTYKDSSGVKSRRVVSPIRFINNDMLLALCLCRETPRAFKLSCCDEIELVAATEVLMPVEIEILNA
jgi:predicted DNA-binding transcriptional regulator YafY